MMEKESAPTVRVERQGAVATVILDRPTARNAVDFATAAALAAAFQTFDADPDLAVGVLYGDHGHFCGSCAFPVLTARLERH